MTLPAARIFTTAGARTILSALGPQPDPACLRQVERRQADRIACLCRHGRQVRAPCGCGCACAASSVTRPELRGFTLVEVLIATLSFAIILAALNSTFYSALNLRAKTMKRVEKAIPLSQAASIIKRDLRGIMAPGGILAGSLVSEVQGMGNNRFTRLEFCTATGALSDDSDWGEVQRVAYYLSEPEFNPENGSMDLVRGVTRDLLPVLTDDFTELPLIHNVESLEFYFYDGIEWQNSWDSTTAATPLPEAIKVSLVFAGEQDNPPVTAPLEFVVPVFVQVRTNQAAASSETSGSQSSNPSPPGSGSSPGGGQSNPSNQVR